MYEIQRFGLENIYCAPSQDRHFNFEFKRVTKNGYPVKRTVSVYNVIKSLPNTSSFFHVAVIGNINPDLLNLLRQRKEWFNDVWINVEDDMNARNILIQVYDSKGTMFPRRHLYYSFIDESSIMIAIEVTETLKRVYDVENLKFLRVYSNSFFNTPEYIGYTTKYGIKCELFSVSNNSDKVFIQNKITSYKTVGGDVMIYVNGYYTDNLNLNIPNNSLIEVVYDQSIISKEVYNISDLRTFHSEKDDKLKYLLFREKIVNFIQYNDDNEIYISTKNELVTRGLYYYEHRDYSVRNVTDKDYSLYTTFVNNQATLLSNLTTGSVVDKVIVIYTRRSGINKSLVYSSLKLHELYKLPQDVELDVLSNMNYTISDLRAETLENSDYFRLASTTNLRDVTKELCTSAIGYNGIKYYYANSPVIVDSDLIVEVPSLFHTESYAYEYNQNGRLINYNITNGPLYTCSSSNVKYVEFIKGNTPSHFDKLYESTESISLRNAEYKLISAYFDGVNRISNWEDITNDESKFSISNGTIDLNEDNGKKVKIVYLDQPLIYDLELPLVDGVLYFPLTVREDRGTGVQNFPLDIPYRSVEIFVNGFRLTKDISYFMKYPYINICDKTYLDYTKSTQSIHIRLHGYTLNKDDINKDEISGFVNNGVLTRNSYYDIRDDRVFSIFIRGRLQNRENILFAEEDNTVRISHPNNGSPYSLTEHMVSVKEICGLDTLTLYNENKEKNDRISSLYNLIYKEPDMNTFNVIPDHYYLFSGLVCKIIHDILDGNISPNIYMNPYNDSTILELIENNYKTLSELDPVRFDLPSSLIEIHPLSTNETISVNLFAYRFINNVVRVLTHGRPYVIDISNFITVNANAPDIEISETISTGGVVVL